MRSVCRASAASFGAGCPLVAALGSARRCLTGCVGSACADGPPQLCAGSSLSMASSKTCSRSGRHLLFSWPNCCSAAAAVALCRNRGAARLARSAPLHELWRTRRARVRAPPGAASNPASSPPEILHRVKSVDCTQRLSPRRLLLLAVGVVKPQRPLGLQRVLLGEIGLS